MRSYILTDRNSDHHSPFKVMTQLRVFLRNNKCSTMAMAVSCMIRHNVYPFSPFQTIINKNIEKKCFQSLFYAERRHLATLSPKINVEMD